jgi:two-component system, NarL family, nitrate/nitrite response regulator NarL
MLRGNVLLVSQNTFLRQGLMQSLGKDTLSVAGGVASLDEALSLLQSGHPQVDVIVIDADTTDLTADIKTLADQDSEVSIVLIAGDPSQIAAQQRTKIKPKALLPTSISAEALNLTLQLVILGENLYLAPGETIADVSPAPRASRLGEGSSNLSPREAEILGFITKGASNKVIARELNVAEATVKVHVKSVLRKIDVDNRTQAAIWAMGHLEAGEFRAA